MFMHVDPSNGIAIYDQIVRQVKFAVASEALKPGNLVPSRSPSNNARIFG